MGYAKNRSVSIHCTDRTHTNDRFFLALSCIIRVWLRIDRSDSNVLSCSNNHVTRPSAPLAMQVFLVFGRTGWIGGQVGELLEQRDVKFEYAKARLEDRAGVLADVERVRF